MNTFSITDTGLVRMNNQDSVFCEENAIGSFPNLFLVADGMGGHKAGDTASRVCVEAVKQQVIDSKCVTPVGVLEEAVAAANDTIYEMASSNSELEGMGTTLVGVTVFEDTAFVVNVGDSRLYQMKDSLNQITVDHSLVDEMVQSGEIQKDEMRTHPNKNIITRALGTDTKVKADCFELEVSAGDVFLLCSDGLTNMVEDKDIEQVLRDNRDDLEKAGRILLQKANDAGGKDNISVVLVGI